MCSIVGCCFWVYSSGSLYCDDGVKGPENASGMEGVGDIGAVLRPPMLLAMMRNWLWNWAPVKVLRLLDVLDDRVEQAF